MQRSLLKALLASSALAATLGLAQAEPVFNRIASFPVASNLPANADPATVTSSEIITVSQDGNTLVYSDSPAGGIGMVDITDPKAPKAGLQHTYTYKGGRTLARKQPGGSKANTRKRP